MIEPVKTKKETRGMAGILKHLTIGGWKIIEMVVDADFTHIAI